METVGYLAAALIGISLGLIGGGGSILTVPVLVYLFGLQPLVATSYSLFVVGSASLVGAFTNWKKGLVSIRTASLFGISSIFTVYVTRKFIVPVIPENIVTIGNITLTSSLLTMVLFAALMLIASFSMISNRENRLNAGTEKKSSYIKLFTYGIVIGLVTGFLGAGGGFLLIPVLVLLIGLPMKKAIGTSLAIIAINSLIGFTGDFGHFSIDWKFLGVITSIAITGIFVGEKIGEKIKGEKLKKGFGWFVLGTGIYIIVKEIILNPVINNM